MKKWRLFISVVAVLGILLCTSVALAGALPDVVVSLQIDDPMMEVNGIESEIDKGRGTKPIVDHGRTLVPVRAIIEAFGGVVGWEEDTKTVLLTMGEDVIKLVPGSKVAYLNNRAEVLDVAPAIIHDRTMLPIRFVAEGFHLGVAWDEATRTVSIIRDSFQEDEYAQLMRLLPEYTGSAYTVINHNNPFLKEYERIRGSFEYYSKLDELGRCDVCFASVAEDLMPTEKRESIQSVKPTGWRNASYPHIDGGYLYNRCHLIGFQLTGENANERNLITGTRYLNVEGMLPFENAIAAYVEETGNRVLYRSTPVFTGDNLVADGVLLEAYSVEDQGQGLSFCVYCYNVQPLIFIDYKTGANAALGETSPDEKTPATGDGEAVSKAYRTPTGKRYHLDAECGGKNSFAVSLEEAKKAGLTPCQKCVQSL